MAYELYKTIRKREEFFNDWDKATYETLSVELRDYIYNKYVVKCHVFQRDNFECQNVNCLSPSSPLTMHHIKAKRNKGLDKVRNCLTLCRSCHKRYERAKSPITIKNRAELPSHIRGHTFILHKAKEINWKKLKKKMRILRKEVKIRFSDIIKDVEGENKVWFKLTWKQIEVLMRFLNMPYDEMDE